MSEGGKTTGAIAGFTNFLLLAFILPGFVYLCFLLLLFDKGAKGLLPEGMNFGADVAVGATVFLGLVITSIAFPIEILIYRFVALFHKESKHRRRPANLPALIFSVDRKKELGWYFWQLWGQTILHSNICIGVSLLYLVYKAVRHEMWPCGLWFSSWRDWFTLMVIITNLVCWVRFSSWFNAVVSKLSEET